MFDKKKKGKSDLEIDDGTFMLTNDDGSETINTHPTLPKNSVEVIFPQAFNDISLVVDTLMLQQKVIVNLDRMNRVERSKTLNFLSGAIYVLKGYFTKIENNVYELEIIDKKR